jgi:hypothetical protein
LEKDIKTENFIPKDIGFSFDLQNTINTFIGDNIYKNKYVAIRECLQNAVDTCRYKKQISKAAYTPEIKINLSNDKLIISDNGLGMDEFIVENYFAKLSKSYYTESKVSSEFEAISQFGIGVFSYFLLCDYFEVETKQEGKEPIKFRVTKDADSYFHFYDNPLKDTTGTIITFSLRDEVGFDEIIKHVRYYLRFIEFPISIFYKERQEIVIAEDFTIDKMKFLGHQIEREFLEDFLQLELVEASIYNDKYEGNLGLLISKDNEGAFIPFKEYNTLGTYRTSKIELSQKGIFVGNTEDRRLKNIIGKINLKRKNEIDLGRYRIKNTVQIRSVTEEFYLVILKKIFESWKSKDSKTKTDLSSKLIGYYFDIDDRFELKFIEPFFEDLFFTVYNGERREYLNISQIINLDEFIIVRKDSAFDGNYLDKLPNVNDLYTIFKKPLILEIWAPPAKYLLDIFKTRKSSISIESTSKHWYFSVKPKKASLIEKENDALAPRYEGYNFDQTHICAYTNLWIERPFNINHEIIKFYITNKEYISRNQELFTYFDKFLSEIHSFMFKVHSSSRLQDPTSEIQYLNSLLIKINEIGGTNFTLKEEDFPIWINARINW